MPFLNLAFDYEDHPKTRRLVGLLGSGAEILPIRLWCYAGKYQAKDGSFTGYTPQEIESLLKWWGPSGKAVEAMLTVGFMEEMEDGFRVHDWKAHQGHIHALKSRNKKVAINRWKRIKDAESTVDTSGIPKRTNGVPLALPIHALPKSTPTAPAKTAVTGGGPPKAEKYEIKTPLGEVVAGFKLKLGLKLDDREWDKVYFKRFSKPAKELLSLFSDDVDKCLYCIEAVVKACKARNLSWKPETIVAHAGEWKATGKVFE